jgi:transcriptional regulator with XRE-family HTH domain
MLDQKRAPSAQESRIRASTGRDPRVVAKKGVRECPSSLSVVGRWGRARHREINVDQYQDDLGSRLRGVRRMQGLTLADVEERSAGEWKAVVVGSYERGDRSMTVARLAEIATFYGVPMSHLLPPREQEFQEQTDRLAVDLIQLEALADQYQTLARYVRRIQQERGDYNGRILTLRNDDLHMVATAEGSNPDALLQELRERALILT